METTARSCLLPLVLAFVITSAACAKSAPADGSSAPSAVTASSPSSTPSSSPSAAASAPVTATATAPAASALATTPRGSASASPVANGPALSASVMRAICTHDPCGGDRPVVRVYRDPGGKVGRLYRIYGTCIHSPGIYFSPDGKETALIPERPIAPGSADAIAIQKQHDAQTAGLRAAEEVRCADVVAPSR